MDKTIKMMMLWENAKASLRNQKGQGMVEYGLILALVAVAVVGGLRLMGTDVLAKFTAITDAL